MSKAVSTRQKEFHKTHTQTNIHRHNFMRNEIIKAVREVE